MSVPFGTERWSPPAFFVASTVALPGGQPHRGQTLAVALVCPRGLPIRLASAAATHECKPGHQPGTYPGAIGHPQAGS